jgi:hypothetical protein
MINLQIGQAIAAIETIGDICRVVWSKAAFRLAQSFNFVAVPND